MPTILREVEIDAPREEVWKVVADIDNEPEYWHGTKEVHNTSREGNVTDRVVTQNFMGTKVTQRVTLKPTESIVVDYLKGTTVGTKLLTLEDIPGGRQRVRVSWDVRFTGVLWLISPVITDHIVKGTENALQRVKLVAEGARKGTTAAARRVA